MTPMPLIAILESVAEGTTETVEALKEASNFEKMTGKEALYEFGPQDFDSSNYDFSLSDAQKTTYCQEDEVVLDDFSPKDFNSDGVIPSAQEIPEDLADIETGTEECDSDAFNPHDFDSCTESISPHMESVKTVEMTKDELLRDASPQNLKSYVLEKLSDDEESSELSHTAEDEPFAKTEGKTSGINETNADTTEKLERTSAFEDQTIDNFKLEEMRPEIEDELQLGEEHSGKVLRHNLDVVTGENPESSNAHHIVGNDTPEAAKKLEEFGIDRNDPANGIFLPDSQESNLKGSVHGPGKHVADYSNEVEKRFSGVSTREMTLEALQSLKEDLYNGYLALHDNIEPNK